MSGSRNYEAKSAEGWVEGPGFYTSDEPHHAQSEHGAWVYVTMHHAGRESAVARVFDDDGEPGASVGELWVREYVPPRMTWEAAEEKKKLKTFIMRSTGGNIEGVDVTDVVNAGTVILTGSHDRVEKQRDGTTMYEYFDMDAERA